MDAAGKLVLGTVQFGCQYGINSAGRPDPDAVRDILAHASVFGLRTLDTSSAYGNSEEVLGGALGTSGGWRIVSKYPKGAGDVGTAFRGSLSRLGVGKLYGYLLHHFEVWKENPAVWEDFRALRAEGLVRKIGFSLYSPEELELLLEKDVDFDLLQIPRNLFDRKFDPYLDSLSERGVEVHVRSTFLQGLFFKDRDALPAKLQPLRPALVVLDGAAASRGVSVADLALALNLRDPRIGGVLIGVDNKDQLVANVMSAGRSVDIEGLDFEIADPALLNPVNWK